MSRSLLPGGAGAAPGGGRLSDDAHGACGPLKTEVLRGEFPLNVRLGETRLAQRLATERLIDIHPDGDHQPLVPDTVVMRELATSSALLGSVGA